MLLLGIVGRGAIPKTTIRAGSPELACLWSPIVHSVNDAGDVVVFHLGVAR